MYCLIEAHCQKVVDWISPDTVNEYDWLVEMLPRVAQSEYQARYRKYWAMNAARLSATWHSEYFRRLQAAAKDPPVLGSLVTDLYQVPTQKNGRQTLQFSFATKLLHMHNRHSPIYDSSVTVFYFFAVPNSALDLSERVKRLEDFHGFLQREYARILSDGLLTASIAAFRARFKPRHFTEEKIIDSLIWAFVSMLWNGDVLEGSVIYR